MPFDTLPRPRLDTDSVHIWLLNFRRCSNELHAQAEQIMSDDEHERAQKFKRGKEEYIASRWLLRRVLAQYVDTPPSDIVFQRTAAGKPYLGDHSIQFNLSHSGSWAALAIGRQLQLGVDIELIRSSRDLIGIAESYFHPQEFATLKTLTPSLQHHYFYQLWTLKEAFLKAIGTGISAGLDKVNFDVQTQSITARFDADLLINCDRWQFHQQQIESGYYCALACTGETAIKLQWVHIN